jgi:outer membrane lipoprotein-sorting protein
MRTRVFPGVGAAAVVGLALVVALPALPASAKALSNAQIQQLENKLNQGKKATYSATYVSSDGSNVTISQQGGKSNFSSTDGSSVINTGKKTYFCSKSSGNSGSTGNSGGSGNSGNSGSTTTTTTKPAGLQCVSEGASNPLGSLVNLFSPALILNVLNEAKVSAEARALGIHLTQSTQKFAGQDATCLSATVRGQAGKYCVTNQGLLAYIGGAGGSTFKMTKYSGSPSPSLFKLPANATVVTVPSVP